MQHTGETPSTISGPARWSPISIGPYRVRGVLGEGGFGTVYLADQEAPIRRQVAIKLLRGGAESAQIVARFTRERQSLGLMEHPNIAQVYEAGEVADGRPFIVMELVRGEPITAHCDTRQLTIRDRLALFEQVCGAVQHAHIKGVIHRDLKPSNVMVTMVDGRALAKVIDFGIAKPVTPREGEQTVYTELRQLVGTPAYMSPEQARGSLDLDIRTDVYSLGVILYELLSGLPPIDPETLKNKSADQVDRIINEKEPPRPSTRIGQSQETRASIAEMRRTDPADLTRMLRGELDWVVMRCLEKEPGRRYQSAAELEADIGRYLRGQAVEAVPPSRVYRARKFVRRNRVLVGATGAVLVTLLAGLGGTLYALHERGVALARVTQQERIARREASRSAAFVKLFVEDVLGTVKPEESEGRDVTVREMMDGAVSMIDAIEDVSVRADVLHQVGKVYLKLGENESAHQHLTRAMALRESDPMATPREKWSVLIDLASACRVLEREEWGVGYATRAYEIVRANKGEASVEAYEVAIALATIHARRGDMAEASRLVQASVFGMGQIEEEGRESMVHAAVLEAAARVIYMPNGQYHEAATAYGRALAIARRNGAPDLEIARHLSRYARAAADARREGGGVAEIEEAVAIARRVLDASNPHLAGYLMAQGQVYMRADRGADGERVMREGLAIYERALGPDSEMVANTLVGLGGPLGKQRKFDEGIAGYRRARQIYMGKFGPDDGRTLNAQSFLGEMLGMAGCHEEAESLLLDAAARLERTGAAPAVYGWTRNRLAALYHEMGNKAESDRWLKGGKTGLGGESE